MYYLVQAYEAYTLGTVSELTRLFADEQLAHAYADELESDPCGYDFASVVELELQQ